MYAYIYVPVSIYINIWNAFKGFQVYTYIVENEP